MTSRLTYKRIYYSMFVSGQSFSTALYIDCSVISSLVLMTANARYLLLGFIHLFQFVVHLGLVSGSSLVSQPSSLIFMMSVPALSDVPRDQRCPITNDCTLVVS